MVLDDERLNVRDVLMGEKNGVTFQAPPLMEILLIEGDSSWLLCTQTLGCSVHFLLQILLHETGL